MERATRVGTCHEPAPGELVVDYRPPSKAKGALLFLPVLLVPAVIGLAFNFDAFMELVRGEVEGGWIVLAVFGGVGCSLVTMILAAVLVLRALNPPQRLHLDVRRGVARLSGRAVSEVALDRVREVVLETVVVRARGFQVDNFYLSLVADDRDLRLPIGGGQLLGHEEGEASRAIAVRVAGFIDRPLVRREP